ncbi:MAG: PAS domain S-box protein, partial [Proteobacteria bacterium]|nr:PAS domain S-box protein [Pseudomonadota bacterium]
MKIDRTITGENWETVEIPIQRKTGEVRWVLWNSANVYGENGEALLSTIAQGQDITERKVAEEALGRSEESFRLISENASDFITLIDREGIMLYASPSHRRLGYDPKEVVGKSALDFITAKDKEKINSLLQLLVHAEKEDLNQMFKEGNSDRYVYGADDKSGNIHYMESTTNIIPNNETGDFNILFVSRDVTERQKAEEALRRSEEQFRLISENSSDLIVLINMQGEYLYASPSHRLFGLEPGDLIGKSAFASIHPDDTEKVMEIGMKFMSADHEELSRIKQKGVNERINCRYIDGWGQIRHLELTGDLVEDAKNQGFNILLIGRDVTESKKIEEEMLKNEKLQSLSVLAGGIAHDFNNLLAAILGNVSVALSTTDSKSEMHELLKDVETASRRAGGLVQQLLTFSRGGSPVKKKMAIGQQLRDDVQIAISGSRVECEYSLPEDLWPVEVDPGQFRQAVSALVINAVQAMPEGGKIGVKAKNLRVGKEFGDNLSEGEYVKISFRDSGKGIPPESLPKI